MSYKIFLHGLESSNQGTKSVFFKERFPEMEIPYFRGDLQERMDKLEGILNGKSSIRIVGSSFGGLMGSLFTLQNEELVERLILLAPAINLLPHADLPESVTHVPVWIYHGTKDDVIPLKDIEPIARKTFPNLTFNTVEDDHFLHKTFKTINWSSHLGSP